MKAGVGKSTTVRALPSASAEGGLRVW